MITVLTLCICWLLGRVFEFLCWNHLPLYKPLWQSLLMHPSLVWLVFHVLGIGYSKLPLPVSSCPGAIDSHINFKADVTCRTYYFLVELLNSGEGWDGWVFIGLYWPLERDSIASLNISRLDLHSCDQLEHDVAWELVPVFKKWQLT